MVEEDLQQKLEEFEEEREHLLKLANTATTLERELEQVFKTSGSQPFLLQSTLLFYSKSIPQGPYTVLPQTPSSASPSQLSLPLP